MPPLQFDTLEIRNPQRTIRRRLQEAGESPVEAAPEPAGPKIPFFKPRTPEERKKQQELLAELLRKRDAGAPAP